MTFRYMRDALGGGVEQFGSDTEFAAKVVDCSLVLDLTMHNRDKVPLLQLHEHLAHLLHVDVRKGVQYKFLVGLRGVFLSHVFVGESLRVHDVHVLVATIDGTVGDIALFAVPRAHLPKRGIFEVVFKGFVCGSDVHLVSFADVHFAQGLHEPGTDTKTLEVGENHQSMDLLGKAQRPIGIWEHCTKAHIGIVPLENPTIRSRIEVVAQIVMRSKYFPDLSLLVSVNLLEGEVDAFPRRNPRRSYTFSDSRSMRMSGLSIGMMS